MRERRKQGTVGWLIIFCALLAWLVIMVDCRKLRVPSRRKQKVVRDKIRQKPQLRQYHSEEYEGFIDPIEDYVAFDEYHDDTDELVSSQKLPEQSVGSYYKPYKQPVKYIQPVYIQPKKPPPKPTTSVIREVHHVPMSGHKRVSMGSAFASGIKYILLTLLALKAAVVVLAFLLLPLKLMIGLKVIFAANVFVFGVLAAKLKNDKSQYWSTVTPTPTVVTPASTSSSLNSQLSISQPVTTVINTPTQQQHQQQPPWSYSYNWWPFYNSQCPACNLGPPPPSNSNTNTKNKIPIIIHIPNKDTDHEEDEDYSLDLFKTPNKKNHAVVPKNL